MCLVMEMAVFGYIEQILQHFMLGMPQIRAIHQKAVLTDSGIGDIVVCGCDDANEYSLGTGYGFDGNTQPCTLQPYRVEDFGNGIYLVSN